ncbi:MAG TPA: histidine kinase [Thermoanaerobaculia bacterium]|nr:histidine kinase [Thermoanaerobaculia bacterium]
MSVALLLFALPLRGSSADISHIKETGEVRYRRTIDLRKIERTPGHPLAVYFAGLGSHEAYWDGVRIGGSGVVGRTAAEEVPGLVEAHYAIPEQLAAPGPHTLELHASAFHRGFTPVHGYWQFGVVDYDHIVTGRTRTGRLALIALSGIVLTAVFAFAMFFVSRRDRSFLLLGTLCLASAALLMAEAWRSLFGYTYDWHLVRLRCIVALSWLVGVQLVALAVTRFPLRHGRAVLGAVAAIAALIPLFPKAWDPKSLYIFIFCGSVATLWTAWAVRRRMHGSQLALAGYLVATLAVFYEPGLFLDFVVYFALDFLFVCLLCSHALEVRRQQDERARLELEMVRRHLQPHFLMNTLTALSEWIEQEPKTAVRMIDALAEELRTLGELSGRTLVPAADELRLCRTHLENMSLRRDVAYALEVHGVDGARLVPPAMFHTLVENAITHAPASAQVTLRLAATAERDRVRYVFESPASNDAPREGGGTRYIQARLREAWGSAWSFRQERSGEVWRTEIEVPA